MLKYFNDQPLYNKIIELKKEFAPYLSDSYFDLAQKRMNVDLRKKKIIF